METRPRWRGSGPKTRQTVAERRKLKLEVSMMGTCEGYTCPVEHRAPQKVVSSQDAGRGRSAEKLAIAAMVHVRMHWRASRTGRHRDRCRESMATVRVHTASSRNSELEHQICARRGRGRPRKPCFQGWEQGCECDLTPFQKFIFSVKKVKKVRAPGLLTDLRKTAQCVHRRPAMDADYPR